MRRLLLFGLFLAGLIWVLMSYPGMANRGTYESIVVDFREDLSASQLEAELNAIAQQFNITPRPNSAFSEADHLYVLEGSAQTLKALRHSDLKKYTESIDPNYIYQALEIPNDPDYSKQWNFRSINMQAAWDNAKGKGVTVAVIDTGISQVPDLKDTSFVKGYDFVNDRVEASDDNGHGTHVAGTIAQSTNNNFGVAGIAYEANLMPLKVLSGGGGGTVADIAEAIRFAADNGAGVINMSLGGGGDADVMREAIDYAYNKGVVIVAAAGNANTNSASYPSRYPNVIAVSALDATGVKAPYSNYGAGVDISAPGGSTTGGNELGGILQNTIDPSTGASVFASLQGTSMASPHVAGVAALIRSVGVEDPAMIAEVLKNSARKVQGDELNHFGAGQLDADAAVKLAQRGNLDVRDFFRWLRDNGYLNLKFWFDGGAVALVPKIIMVLGSYILAWLLRTYLPFGFALSSGLVMGSSGLFFLRGFYIFDLPQAPFRLLGSSIPELGSAIQGSAALNPLFASVLIPFGLIALFLSHKSLKWFAIGTTLGVAACLAVSAVLDAELMGLGSGAIARTYLAINAFLCLGLAFLSAKSTAE
ncbi:MAG: S8 family peptidase [Oculatellaceae cyanobacterium Prado106]|jgi:serine protease|nr:S8 family peptidase [Oculatellaceae cyanobacterium Prado106]